MPPQSTGQPVLSSSLYETDSLSQLPRTNFLLSSFKYPPAPDRCGTLSANSRKACDAVLKGRSNPVYTHEKSKEWSEQIIVSPPPSPRPGTQLTSNPGVCADVVAGVLTGDTSTYKMVRDCRAHGIRPNG